MASPTPVLPEVGSTMVPPLRNSPSASAASIMARAGRSLMLLPGLRNSSLASSWPDRSRPMRSIRTSGVLPISSISESAASMGGPGSVTADDLDARPGVDRDVAVEDHRQAGPVQLAGHVRGPGRAGVRRPRRSLRPSGECGLADRRWFLRPVVRRSTSTRRRARMASRSGTGASSTTTRTSMCSSWPPVGGSATGARSAGGRRPGPEGSLCGGTWALLEGAALQGVPPEPGGWPTAGPLGPSPQSVDREKWVCGLDSNWPSR